ncbi:NYN domain-containing protein [Mariniluteicoccus flavus]
MTTLVIDAANVIGSRPDGWWRDRPGAARRLHEALTGHDLAYAEVVLVLEGLFRRGVSAGTEGGVTTVHAPTDGDSEIVAQVATRGGEGIDVVTSDRGLIARIEALGAHRLPCSWLLDQLHAG